MTIAADKTNSTTSTTDHPTHHNDLATAVNELVTPTAPKSMNGQRISNLGTPTSDLDAVTKAYADAITAGLAWKDAVRVATTANGTLATAFENGDTVNGVVLATGNRILLKAQTAPAENGVYTVNASGAPTRATDADSEADLLGAAVFASEGTTGAGSTWVLTTPAPIVVGTTGLTWVQFGTGTAATPTTTRGDLIKRGASVDERLGIGTLGQELRTVDIGSGVLEPRWRSTGVFNIVDYGADVTGAADSSAAIIAAVAAASTGDVIWSPPGIYLLNSNVPINKSVSFLGAGTRNTRFRLGGNNIGLSFNDAQATAYQQITIGGFLISSTVDRSAGSAITLGNIGQCLVKEIMISNNHGGRPFRGITITSGCTQTRFQELMIFNCADYGIYVYQDGSLGSIIDLWFEDGSQINDNNNTALKLYNAAPSLVRTIEGIYVGKVSLAGSNGTGLGMDVDVASTAQIKNIFLDGTILDGNVGAGFGTNGAGIIQVIRLENIWVSHNHSTGIVLGDQVQDFVIDGGHCNINYANGVQLYGAKNGRVSNVSIISNAEVTGGSYGLIIQNSAARITCVGNRIANNTTIYPTNAQNGVQIDSGCSDIDLFANFLDTGGATTRVNDSGTRTRKLGNVIDATSAAVPVQSNLAAAGSVLSSSASAGIGYATGAGGTVTQATSKTTGVTLNTITGAITMNAASLGSSVEATFTVTNSTVTATDAIIVNHASGGTAGAYLVGVASVGAGSFQIVVGNVTAGSLAEAIVLRFVVIKAVSA